jgi:archaellum biogenesis ATPase FlaH
MTDNYVLRNDSDAMKPQPPIEYVINDLITNSSLNVFYGEAGSKKTYVTISMAVAVVNGDDWLGFSTKKSPVIFIDEESGEKRFTRRLSEVMKGTDHVATEKLFYVSLAGFKLDNKEDIKTIESQINRTESKLIIIDALADIMDGDENSKKDVQPIMNALRKIADNTNSAIVLIHHSNKSGGYRGSSAIKASSDLMIQVDSELDQSVVTFKTEKNRDGSYITWSADAIWENDLFYLTPISPIAKNNGREEYVLSFLRDNGESLVSEIIENPIGYSKQGIRKVIYNLAKEGRIIRTNLDAGNKGAKYTVV